jgi:hypothetical protein
MNSQLNNILSMVSTKYAKGTRNQTSKVSLYVIELVTTQIKKHGTIKLFIYIQYVTCMPYNYVCI